MWPKAGGVMDWIGYIVAFIVGYSVRGWLAARLHNRLLDMLP